MSKKANGTSWYMGRATETGSAMSSNITPPQDGQRWISQSEANLIDEDYHTINLPSLTLTSTPSHTGSPSPAPTSPDDQSGNSNGLSKAASAIITIIPIVVGGLFLWRKRRSRQPTPTKIEEMQHEMQYEISYQSAFVKPEMYSEGVANYEMSAGQAQAQGQAPLELPSNAYYGHSGR
ncbi:hypothetical protein BS50DRAFT_580782 [Corynespora cassiicola Philippines]|uniref:Uncharacterized protein n=1 Tax=Corynespora cassiicola Philippines TaxID=1448308 RepID=A0A2T2P8D8_CORCC|nr:hypothetical protein BS50DRAFT_580782 [Corynespora cassiicola Philippines]